MKRESSSWLAHPQHPLLGSLPPPGAGWGLLGGTLPLTCCELGSGLPLPDALPPADTAPLLGSLCSGTARSGDEQEPASRSAQWAYTAQNQSGLASWESKRKLNREIHLLHAACRNPTALQCSGIAELGTLRCSLSEGELNHSTSSSVRKSCKSFLSTFCSKVTACYTQTQQQAPPQTHLFSEYFMNQFSLQNKFLSWLAAFQKPRKGNPVRATTAFENNEPYQATCHMLSTEQKMLIKTVPPALSATKHFLQSDFTQGKAKLQHKQF